MNEAMKQALAESADTLPPPGDGEPAGFAPDGFPIVVCGVDTEFMNHHGIVLCGACQHAAVFKAHGALCQDCGHYCGLEVPTVAVEHMLEHNATMREVIAEQERAKAQPDNSYHA